MGSALDTICRENQTITLVELIPSKIRAVYEIMWKNIVKPDRPRTFHAYCMLDN